MIASIFLFCVGLVLLVVGSDRFVDGASDIARRFHIPDLVIGATIVSIGTTLPEVTVSATSALTGHSELAYGNAIGSIICNTALIAAITVTVKPGPVSKAGLKIPASFFFGTAILFAVNVYSFSFISRPLGLFLVCCFAAYSFLTAKNISRSSKQGIAAESLASTDMQFNGDMDEYGINEPGLMPLQKSLFFLVAGAVLVAFGARLLVSNGIVMARAFGVPESVIGLTFVALGTSLPELATAITSLIKGHGSMSLGNVIGANLFNLVLVIGISASLAPFAVPESMLLFGHNASLLLDIPLMFIVMLLLIVPAILKGRLFRWQGVMLLILYFSFCAIEFMLG